MTESAHPPLLRIEDLFLQEALVLGPRTTLRDAARAMRARDVSSAVVGVASAPVAIVTERDVTRAVAEGRTPDEPVELIATSDPVTVDPRTGVLDAATTMLRSGLRHLVVAQEHRVVGVVSMRDVLTALVTASTADTVIVRLDRLSLEPPEIWLG